ncbi:hypothetical protein Cgig2_020781 [Carnegiea gigantea]|uniref:Uncharacterized protein n=1 Tax=Carnegiea gigantea TaxID=171969 RepID=A0A9Q1JIS1_9CARY|nr:hypothetical protein Cgig2_020781 [Carnegiea gigantea]
MYQKEFITRMSIRSFSSMVAQLNEAQTEVVRSMGFDFFLKFNLKQILGKFSKWLVESFDPGKAFDVYLTLGVPIGEREIMEITKSSTDEKYNEMHAAWVKQWKIEHTAPKLTCMPEFFLAKKDGGKGFKRNFIIYLLNCFFSGPKNSYYSKSILKYVKDVNQIASLDWCKFILRKLITSVRAQLRKHATHDKQTEKAKEKEELPTQPVDKVAEKRKPSEDPADKPLSKKAKRDKISLESRKDDEPARESVAKGEDNKKSSEQIAAKNIPSDDEGR